MESRISISQIRQITEKIFDHVQNRLELDSIDINPNEENYWTISRDELFDMDNIPKVNEVGNLIEDLDFLLPLISNEREPIGALMEHLVPLLLYIGKSVER